MYEETPILILGTDIHILEHHEIQEKSEVESYKTIASSVHKAKANSSRVRQILISLANKLGYEFDTPGHDEELLYFIGLQIREMQKRIEELESLQNAEPSRSRKKSDKWTDCSSGKSGKRINLRPPKDRAA